MGANVRARARGVVESIEADREGAQEIRVRVGEESRAAIVYPALTGRVSVGDAVVLNTWAVEMGLGTGGVDFVTEVGRETEETDAPGHIMKLRYTPLQHPVLAVEAPECEHHAAVS